MSQYAMNNKIPQPGHTLRTTSLKDVQLHDTNTPHTTCSLKVTTQYAVQPPQYVNTHTHKAF